MLKCRRMGLEEQGRVRSIASARVEAMPVMGDMLRGRGGDASTTTVLWPERLEITVATWMAGALGGGEGMSRRSSLCLNQSLLPPLALNQSAGTVKNTLVCAGSRPHRQPA